MHRAAAAHSAHIHSFVVHPSPDRRELDKRIGAYGDAVSQLRLQMVGTSVEKDDLKGVEDRLGKRFETVEHQLLQLPQQFAGIVRSLGLRAPRRAEEE